MWIGPKEIGLKFFVKSEHRVKNDIGAFVIFRVGYLQIESTQYMPIINGEKISLLQK